MSTKISETIIQFGSLDKRHFDKARTAGAWEQFTVKFPVSFPNLNRLPSVIVTPSDYGMTGFTANKIIPAVGIDVDTTLNGFTLAARNASRRRGFAGFNWMAILETPGTDQKPIDIRMGVTQPKYFQTNPKPVYSYGSHHGPRDWYITYPSLNQKETPLVSATNLYGTKNRNAAVVGMVVNPHFSGFNLFGENADHADGDSAFYFVSVAGGEKGIGQDVWVEAGGTASMELAASGKKGSWNAEEVTFKDPFMTPPIVLVTAGSPKSAKYRGVAALGIAQYVTTHGFTLAAHNTDVDTKGLAWFSWVAFGCGRFCAWPKSSRD